jgi:MFS family permease
LVAAGLAKHVGAEGLVADIATRGLAVEVRGLATVAATVRPAARAVAASPSSAAGLLRRPRFLMLVVVGALLSVTTISDGFLYLVIQRRMDFNIGFFPLLYIGTALSYFALAVPAGWLADRVGRGRVFVGGYVVLLAVYTALLQPSFGRGHVIIYLGLFGAYYAATDGVLMALASPLIPRDARSSGLSILTTVTSLSALAGSVLFGALWTWQGANTAVAAACAGLVVATLLAAVCLLPRQENVSDAPVSPSPVA